MSVKRLRENEPELFGAVAGIVIALMVMTGGWVLVIWIIEGASA